MSPVAGPSTAASPDGSRTLVVQDAQPREEERDRIDGVIHVRATRRSQPRVTWTEDVVDNEGMGKKKTKICCIYRKQKKRFDESSSSSSDSDSSDSGSDSDSGAARPSGRFRDQSNGRHPHPHDQNGQSGGNAAGGQATRDGGGSSTVQKLSDDEYEPNAYERQPGKRRRPGPGKGKRPGKEADKGKDKQPQPPPGH